MHIPKWEVNMRNFHIFKYFKYTSFKITQNSDSFHWNEVYEFEWFVGTQQFGGVTRSNQKSRNLTPESQAHSWSPHRLSSSSVPLSWLAYSSQVYYLPPALWFAPWCSHMPSFFVCGRSRGSQCSPSALTVNTLQVDNPLFPFLSGLNRIPTTSWLCWEPQDSRG